MSAEPESRIDQVIELHRSGMTSYAQIAERTGMTRNMVAGIVSRARRTGRLPVAASPNFIRAQPRRPDSPPRKPKPPKPAKPPKLKPEPKPAAVKQPPRPLPVSTLPAAVNLSPTALIQHRREAFDQMISSGGCKFPVGKLTDPDFHFCCAPRDGEHSYCPTHRARATQPAYRSAR